MCFLCDVVKGNGLKPIYEDEVCLVVMGSKRGVPMILARTHGVPTSKEIREHMLRVAVAQFDASRIVETMNSVPDHYHIHIYK